MTEVSVAVKEIITTRPVISTWNTIAVAIVDYGTAEQITLTLESPSGTQLTKSTLIYEETTKAVKIISTTTVDKTESLTTSEQIFESVTSTVHPVTTVPQVVISSQIKTDVQLQTVITQIQKSDVTLINVLPETIQIQQLSDTVTQYISVISISGVEKQVVSLFDSTTNVVTVISNTTIDQSVKPYYLTQTTTASGVVVTSNNVQQLISTHTEMTSILEYSKEWISISTDFSNVVMVQVEPSPISGTIIYTIETVEGGQTQTIEVSYSETTKKTTVINLEVKPIEIVYPQPSPIVTINVTTQTA